MTRTPQGSAKIKYWGGVERKANPMVLVYDDGTTNPTGRPVWRKKMQAIDVINMHEKGLMEPITCHESCKKSSCATLDELQEMAKDQSPSDRVNIGSRADGSERVTVQISNTFPWREDADSFQFRNRPKDRDVKWNEDGSFKSASAVLMRDGEELAVTIGNKKLSVVGAEDEPEVLESVNGDQLWAEWWFFRCERMSYAAFLNMINACSVSPISDLPYPIQLASESVKKKIGKLSLTDCDEATESIPDEEYEKGSYDDEFPIVTGMVVV